jgi:hypothetical protein
MSRRVGWPTRNSISVSHIALKTAALIRLAALPITPLDPRAQLTTQRECGRDAMMYAD